MIRNRAAFALLAFVTVFAVVHAVVGWWTPIQGDDWNHWVWAGRHRDDHGVAWLFAWLKTHYTFSEAVGYVLARCRVVHALVSPVVTLGLIVGLFTVAMRRLPLATWQDVLGLVLASTLVWIGQPWAGVTLFHTANVAFFVYGSALMLWFIAPVRCDWQPPRALWSLLAIAGYCVGTSTRAIATATLVYFIFALRTKRAPWMWVAFAGLVIGVIVGYASPPWLEIMKVVRRGFEPNLVGRGLLSFTVAKTGELVALTAVLVLANAALGLFNRTRAPADAAPEPTDTLRWMAAWIGTEVWCLFGPHYDRPLVLPATCMLVVAALPYLVWLARAPAIRYVLLTIAILVHAVSWWNALTRYHKHHEMADERMETLSNAKPGDTVTIHHYSPAPEDDWFLGEDLGSAQLRQLVAIDAFGLRDITVDPPYRHIDPNPGIELELETDGATPEELEAAHVPAFWANDVAAARKQFDLFVARLHARAPHAAARLVVKNVDVPLIGSRKLYAAWADATGSMIPRVSRSSVTWSGEYTVRIYRPYAEHLTEGYVLLDGEPKAIKPRDGQVKVLPLTQQRVVIVACTADRCVLADAFYPRI